MFTHTSYQQISKYATHIPILDQSGHGLLHVK